MISRIATYLRLFHFTVYKVYKFQLYSQNSDNSLLSNIPNKGYVEK